MRKTKVCPKCDCKKLVAIDTVVDAMGGGSPSTQASIAVRNEGYSFLGNKKMRAVGKLQAVLCSECGFTELYCADPKDVQPDGESIRWLT